MTVGVLALHGDFAEHLAVLTSLRIHADEVRTPEDLRRVHRLIIPGGESTVIAKLLSSTGLRKAIQTRVREGSLPLYGTCAGAILLARRVRGKKSATPLGLVDITVDRNAYGTQLQSFEATIRVKSLSTPLRVAFIRAPKITAVGKGVTVLAELNGSPVLVLQGRILAGTFHPEIRGEAALHRMFLAL